MQVSKSSQSESNSADKLSVFALSGSLHRQSYNRKLLQVAKKTHGSMNINIFKKLADIPMFNQDLESQPNGVPQSVLAMREQVLSADAVLIATPEYNQSIPGVLKNALDWLSRSETESVLMNKPVAILGVTIGLWGTRIAQTHLRHVLTACGMQTMHQPSLYIANAKNLFNENVEITDKEKSKDLQLFLLAFEQWINTKMK